MFQYYKDCEDDWKSFDDEFKPIKSPSDIWKHVGFGSEPRVFRRRDGDKGIYISIACGCDWEPEHGMEIVFKDGLKLVKVGPDDGAPYGDDNLDITATKDLETFVGELSRLPDGAEVAWVNTCAAPLHYGMPTNKLSKIQEVLKRKRLKLAGIDDDNFILCTCETTNLVFFAKAPTGNANKTVQQTGASRSPSDPNQTSSAAGSRR